MRKLSMEELGRKSVEEFKESPKTPVIAVLENVRSAYNVGSVFRTADAFLIEAVETLKQDGYKVFAIEQVENSISLEKFDAVGKIAVIFGNEVSGVEQSTIALCDGTIEIPQLGMKHSLNIATAVGVVLWELVRKGIV